MSAKRLDHISALPTYEDILESDELSKDIEDKLLALDFPKKWLPLARLMQGGQYRLIIDDSPSTNKPIPPEAVGEQLAADNNIVTRWDYLKFCAIWIMKAALLFDDDGIDIDFLNRSDLSGVTDEATIIEAMRDPPSRGHTPLGECFRAAEEAAAQAPPDKPLTTIILSDGSPTDMTIEEFGQLIENRNGEQMFLVMYACTHKKLDFYDALDKSDPALLTISPYNIEVEQVAKHNAMSFTVYHMLAIALLGILVPELDQLDERKVSMKKVLAKYAL